MKTETTIMLMTEDLALRDAVSGATWSAQAKLAGVGILPARINAPGASRGQLLGMLAPFALCIALPRPACLVLNVVVDERAPGGLLAGWLLGPGRADGFVEANIQGVLSRVERFLTSALARGRRSSSYATAQRQGHKRAA